MTINLPQPMKLIHRYKQQGQSCWGISLFQWNNFKLELWFCPPGFKIIPHSHNLQDIELMFLWGNAKFTRNKMLGDGNQSFMVEGFKHTFKRFTIDRGVLHWFEVSDKWLVFLNFERWICKPTSASIDFQVTSPKAIVQKQPTN